MTGRGAPRSQRQRVVSVLWADGHPVWLIAQSMLLSPETVKSYLKMVRKNYRVAGRVTGNGFDKVELRKLLIEDGLMVEVTRDIAPAA